MDTLAINTCPSENFEIIPEEALAGGGISFPEAHVDADMMEALAVSIQRISGDKFAQVPFCVTVEAELLGGRVNLGDGKSGPRVSEYAYRSISELLESDFSMPLDEGRLGTVLSVVERLSKSNPVILNVSGLFTLLSSLLDLSVLYKALRSDPERSAALLRKTSDFILRVIATGADRGASIISYADPVCDISLMGQKTFARFAAPVTCELIERALDLCRIPILHVCGRLTNSLYRAEVLDITPISLPGAQTYGDALLETLQRGDIRLIGNNCIKKTHLPDALKVVYALRIRRVASGETWNEPRVGSLQAQAVI
jgi:uroporphyrinogen-III decarboxylase